jgi:hypothetical protein
MTAYIDKKGDVMNRIEILIKNQKAKAEQQLEDSKRVNSRNKMRYKS